MAGFKVRLWRRKGAALLFRSSSLRTEAITPPPTPLPGRHRLPRLLGEVLAGPGPLRLHFRLRCERSSTGHCVRKFVPRRAPCRPKRSAPRWLRRRTGRGCLCPVEGRPRAEPRWLCWPGRGKSLPPPRGRSPPPDRPARKPYPHPLLPPSTMFKKLKQKISEEQVLPRGAVGRAGSLPPQVRRGAPAGRRVRRTFVGACDGLSPGGAGPHLVRGGLGVPRVGRTGLAAAGGSRRAGLAD